MESSFLTNICTWKRNMAPKLFKHQAKCEQFDNFTNTLFEKLYFRKNFSFEFKNWNEIQKNNLINQRLSPQKRPPEKYKLQKTNNGCAFPGYMLLMTTRENIYWSFLLIFKFTNISTNDNSFLFLIFILEGVSLNRKFFTILVFLLATLKV